MFSTLLFLIIQAASLTPATGDSCSLVSAMVEDSHGYLGAGDCVDVHATWRERIQVEPLLETKAGGYQRLLPDGTKCGPRFLVVDHEKRLRERSEPVGAVVIEMRRAGAGAFEFHAYTSRWFPKGGVEYPTCGGERYGSVKKVRGRWVMHAKESFLK